MNFLQFVVYVYENITEKLRKLPGYVNYIFSL